MERAFGGKLRIFLDSSVALAASMSSIGASHEVFHLAGYQDWNLLASPWVLREVQLNLVGSPSSFVHKWVTMRFLLGIEDDELTFDWPVTFGKSEGRGQVLLSTVRKADFG